MGRMTEDFIKCDECTEWIRNNTRSKLKHLNTAHRVKNDSMTATGKFICSFCEKPYAAPNTLKRHQLHFHGVADETPAPVLCVKMISNTTSKYYNCDNLKPTDFVFSLKFAPQIYYSREQTNNGTKYVRHTDWQNRGNNRMETNSYHTSRKAGELETKIP